MNYHFRKSINPEAATSFPDDSESQELSVWAWLLLIAIISLVMIVR